MTAKILKFNKPQLHKPPRPFGKHGSALWQAVTNEYGILDAGGMEMLTQACQALDSCRRTRRRHLSVTDAFRSKEIIPDHKHELAARSFVVRSGATWREICFSVRPSST